MAGVRMARPGDFCVLLSPGAMSCAVNLGDGPGSKFPHPLFVARGAMISRVRGANDLETMEEINLQGVLI